METIAAISTPQGVGAVGMIRISGKDALNILSRLWITSPCPVQNIETHRFYYAKLSTANPKFPDGREIKGPIDSVLVVYMKTPHSYTGEDVVEIHCHGGALVTQMVLEAVILSGASPAAPGEFTRRAFMNGKMDLSEAEAVADIISASSEKALAMAEQHLSGGLSKKIATLQDELKDIKAILEASIDFPEEDVEILKDNDVGEKTTRVKSELQKLLDSYHDGRKIKDGVKVVIIGRSNVGKSSLLNALLQTDRAIVHHAPGTTRDTIEEELSIGGILFKLIDTAGLRETACDVERMGIDKTLANIQSADISIVVLDVISGVTDEDTKILDEIRDVKKIIVLNKMDISRRMDAPYLRISALTGEGLDDLKKEMIRISMDGINGETEGVVITNLRHKIALEEVVTSLKEASLSIDRRESSEFTAVHLQRAMSVLGRITGEVTTEDVLNEIFSKFCIGK